jgi:diguanylate cyclase (GGDEF)-like protein
VELLQRLEESARTDDLIGLPNRRAWEHELSRELARSDRMSIPVCVAMLDLDRFKAFNDGSGHQAGDGLLRRTAAAWKERLRSSDLLARYGGDEFALLLPACTLDEAERLVQRLRVAMPDSQTVSVGLACWDGAESAEALVGRADAALYEAKRAGRDRLIAA